MSIFIVLTERHRATQNSAVEMAPKVETATWRLQEVGPPPSSLLTTHCQAVIVSSGGLLPDISYRCISKYPVKISSLFSTFRV